MKATPSVTPPLHVYEVAPPPVSVTLLPAQTALAVEFAVTVGNGLTVTVTFAVLVQPAPLVPVTVYVVVEVGETETVVPLNDPGIQV